MGKDKIKISKIHPDVHKIKGFDEGAFNECLDCSCGEHKKGGSCCELGVYVDKESYDLIMKNKHFLEKKIKIPIENCFYNKWSDDKEFLGGAAISTRIKNKRCVFQSKNGKGCELVSVVIKNDLPKRMIPTACRIYPLNWWEGELNVVEVIEKGCYCVHENNKSKRSIFQTHKEELDDVFDICLDKCKK